MFFELWRFECTWENPLKTKKNDLFSFNILGIVIHIIWSYIVTQEFIGVWRHDKKRAVDWIMGPSNIINDCEILEQNRNMHFVNMYIYETCETRFLRMRKTCIVLDICYKMLTDCSFIAYLDLVFNDVRDLWNKRSYFQLLNQKWNRKWRQTLHKKCMKSFFRMYEKIQI